MATTKLTALLALLAIFLCYANAQSCTASVNATRQATWVDGQVQSRSLWTVSITAGSVQVLDVFLNIAGNIAQIWEVDLVNGSLYHLPAWRRQQGGLPAGQTHVFGFIVNDANTNSPVTVSSVQCVLASPQPSASPVASASASPAASVTASPAASASASPAASASPSAAASASPAATPSASPAACRLSASQVARQGPGGMWTDNSNRFQIYDLTFQNLGSQRISQASISFTIASDQQITDAWNLRRVDSSNEFFIESSVLPAPGQTQMGAGYILRTPLNSTSAGSSIGEVDAVC